MLLSEKTCFLGSVAASLSSPGCWRWVIVPTNATLAAIRDKSQNIVTKHNRSAFLLQMTSRTGGGSERCWPFPWQRFKDSACSRHVDSYHLSVAQRWPWRPSPSLPAEAKGVQRVSHRGVIVGRAWR